MPLAVHAMRFECPRCNTTLAYERDLQRHMDEKCYNLDEWQCPDCSKAPFVRKSRFRQHHKQEHCFSSGPCSHDKEALRKGESRVYGCGVCAKNCHGTVEFRKHISRHQKFGGSINHDWNNTKEIKGLLDQTHILPLWQETVISCFGPDPRKWPEMHCSKTVADRFAPMLECRSREGLLHEELSLLLSESMMRPSIQAGPTGIEHAMVSLGSTPYHVSTENEQYGSNMAHAMSAPLYESPGIQAHQSSFQLLAGSTPYLGSVMGTESEDIANQMYLGTFDEWSS